MTEVEEILVDVCFFPYVMTSWHLVACSPVIVTARMAYMSGLVFALLCLSHWHLPQELEKLHAEIMSLRSALRLSKSESISTGACPAALIWDQSKCKLETMELDRQDAQVAHIHICCRVKKLVQCLLSYVLKIGPFLFSKIAFSLQKEEEYSKQTNKQEQKITQKTQLYVLEIDPILLRSILGPAFNLYLDQFLTHTQMYVYIYRYFVICWNPYSIVFSANNAKFWRHTKTKKKIVNTLVVIAFVKMSFFSIFHFWCFRISIFREMFLIGSQNSNNNKYQSNKTKKNNNKKRRHKTKEIQSGGKSSIVIQNKARQEAEKQKQRNTWKQKAN